MSATLGAMQTAIKASPMAGAASASESSFEDASFAGMLAALATPQNRDVAWNDEELADDVATISCERALRSQARVSLRSCDSPRDHGQVPTCGENQAIANCHSDASPALNPPKTARFTIRLSETESAQLRQRTAEARMTVSEYLRLCTLEVENLRAQVKDALAELRNTPHRATLETRTESKGGFVTAFHRLKNWFGSYQPECPPGP